jgi:AraC-like DNA-binding protein
MTGPDQARFWRPADWPGIELMRARWVRHSFARHFHDCYTIGVNEAGWGTFDCRRAKQIAAPGCLNLIGPGETHTGAAGDTTGWSYGDFYIEPALMRSLAADAGFDGTPEFRAAAVEDADLARALRRTFDLLVAGRSSRLEQECVLIAAIRQLCERHTDLRVSSEPHSNSAGPIGRIRDYLQAHWPEDVSIAALAALGGWSPYHTIRTFHRVTGITPHAYQTVVRVNRVKELLRRGISLADAAATCGFCDQSHMHRAFRGMAGVTPGAYRRQTAVLSKTPR